MGAPRATCPKCRAQLTDSSVVCAACGASLELHHLFRVRAAIGAAAVFGSATTATLWLRLQSDLATLRASAVLEVNEPVAKQESLAFVPVGVAALGLFVAVAFVAQNPSAVTLAALIAVPVCVVVTVIQHPQPPIELLAGWAVAFAALAYAHVAARDLARVRAPDRGASRSRT